MNRASPVAIQDFVATGTKLELDDLERRIAQRRAELASQPPAVVWPRSKFGAFDPVCPMKKF